MSEHLSPVDPPIVNDQDTSRSRSGSSRVLGLFASLRVRLIFLVLLVITPATGLLLYVADREREDGKDDVRENALHLARLAAAEQVQLVHGTHSLLQHLATMPEARGAAARGACNDLMAREIKLYAYYDNLGVLGPDGIRFCSVLLPEQRIDLSDRIYFRRTLETRDFSIGEYQIGRSSKKASIGFGYPVLDLRGAVRGVVYATLNLDWLGQSLARKQLPSDAVLSVVDDKGTILARFPDSDQRAGTSISPAVLREMLSHQGTGTLENDGEDGARLVWGYVPLLSGPAGTLIVRVSVPVAIAYAHVERTYYRNLLLVGLTFLGVMLIGWGGSERLILRPVNKLGEAARRLGRGEYGARTGVTYAAGEVGELARVFDNMAQALQERGARIEQAIRELHALSMTDELTGLHNRRFLLEILPRELTLARRNKMPVTIMMIDIDFFKRVNDTYGHEAGDRVLKETARSIKSAVRGSDYTCRYGGEEFLLVLPDATLEGACARAEIIRAGIQNLEVICADQKHIAVTASIGVAAFPDHGSDVGSLLQAADKALYEAKGAGRNQVVVALR